MVSGHPALRLRAAAPGLADSPSMDWQRTGSHPCDHPAGLSPPLRHCIGDPFTAHPAQPRANQFHASMQNCLDLRRRSYFSRKAGDQTAGLPFCAANAARRASARDGASSGAEGGWGALALDTCFSLWLRTMRSYWGPVSGGGRAQKRPAGWARKDARQFAASHGGAVSEPPEPLRAVAGQEPGDHCIGVAFSLVTFLLATQEKVGRSPQASESFALFSLPASCPIIMKKAKVSEP